MNHLATRYARFHKHEAHTLNDARNLAAAVMDPLLLRDLATRYPAADVLRALRRQGMVEMCNYNDHTIPVRLGALIEDQCKLSAALEMLQHLELRQVFSCLEDAGIRDILIIKGTALAYSVYKGSVATAAGGYQPPARPKFTLQRDRGTA